MDARITDNKFDYRDPVRDRLLADPAMWSCCSAGAGAARHAQPSILRGGVAAWGVIAGWRGLPGLGRGARRS